MGEGLEEEGLACGTKEVAIVIAVGYEGGALALIKETGKGLHIVYLGQVELMALLHGCYGYLAQALGLDDATLRKLAVEEGDTVYAYLSGFLYQPLHTVDILGGGYSKVYRVWPGAVMVLYMVGMVTALVPGGPGDGGCDEVAPAIDDVERVTCPEAQHPEGMGCLVSGKDTAVAPRFRVVKIASFLHGCRRASRGEESVKFKVYSL